MDNVLIVDQDPAKLENIKEYLGQLAQFAVMTASSEKKVRNTLKTTPVSVLVLDMDMPKMDPLDLLTLMTRRHADVPCIVTSDRPIPVFADLKDEETVLRYLKKPFDFSVLAMDIFEALTLRDEGLSFGGMLVRCFLPLLEITQKTGCLTIHSRRKNPGVLYFRNGNLIDADYENLTGEEAALELMGLRQTEMTLTALPQDKTENHIHKELINLIGAHWSDKSPDAKIEKATGDNLIWEDLPETPPEVSTPTPSSQGKYNLDSVCQELLTRLDDARGVAIIDLRNGEILAFVQTTPCLAQGHAATAAATMDLFRSQAVEKLLSLEQGAQNKTITQIQMTTEKTYHFMSIIPDKENILLVLTTGKQSNLGIGWMAMREALSKVAPLCPIKISSPGH